MADAHPATDASVKTMSELNKKLLKDKEMLAKKALEVANGSLVLLETQLGEASTQDLTKIFASAVKAHREIISDIVEMTSGMAEDEALSKEYSPKVDQLLKKLQARNE